jgi:uncharacterized protein
MNIGSQHISAPPGEQNSSGNRQRTLFLLLVIFVGLLMNGCNRFIESQVFYPSRTLSQTPAVAHLSYEDIWFTASDEIRLHGWWVPAEPVRFVILFCHGNAGNISHRIDNIFRLNQMGLSVFIFDYRGYGRSEGRASETGLYLDTEAAYGKARELADRHGAKLLIFGRSLGGVAAVHVGSNYASDGVILESTFTNMGSMARVHYLLPFLETWLQGRLAADTKIGAMQAPLMMIHGDQDRIVPIKLGKKLFAAAPEPKTFYTIAGADHNNTYQVGGEEYFLRLASFIGTL